MRLETWERTLRVNLTGVFLMSRAAIALMRRNNWGRIVNISSRSARTNPGISNANYAASKAGALGMARILAAELGGSGITVNTVAPSRIVTGMTLAAAADSAYFDNAVSQTPIGRLCEPSDVANAVSFYCSQSSSFLTGTVLDVTGGSFMP
jgi:3-oxoacyl-[acyl-carrier protein] reductase